MAAMQLKCSQQAQGNHTNSIKRPKAIEQLSRTAEHSARMPTAMPWIEAVCLGWVMMPGAQQVGSLGS